MIYMPICDVDLKNPIAETDETFVKKRCWHVYCLAPGMEPVHAYTPGEPAAERYGRHVDVNAVGAGYLRDLAFAQPTKPQMFGYKRAAAAILGLDTSLTTDRDAMPKIPASARVRRA